MSMAGIPLVILSSRVAPIAQQMWDYDHGAGWGWWLVMVVLMVLFWVSVIALVAWGIRSFTRGPVAPPPAQPDSALEIARQRYARGEISEEEFQRIRRGLS